MDVIISVDTKRMNVLVSIHDTFNNECVPSKEIEDVMAGTNEKIIQQIQDKLSLSYCQLDPTQKWKKVSNYKGYASASCNIVRSFK